MAKEKRNQTRREINQSILYSKDLKETYQNGFTYNLSHNGICFKTGLTCDIGECVFVKVSAPAQDAAQASPDLVTQVKWCQKAGSTQEYKIGVERMGRVIYMERSERHPPFCEFCGTRMTDGPVIDHDRFYFCVGCFSSLHRLHGNTLKSHICDFMAGNVI